MEIAGTTQRGAAPWCGDQGGPQVDLLGAQRWHGHGDHGGRAQLWRSLWHPEVVQSKDLCGRQSGGDHCGSLGPSVVAGT